MCCPGSDGFRNGGLHPKYCRYPEQYWTWASQLAPLWCGLTNLLGGYASSSLRGRISLANSTKMLIILVLVSAGVWIYALQFSPYSLSMLFVPQRSRSGFVVDTRGDFQADHLAVFSSSLLWLSYSYFDFYIAGLIGNIWILYVVSLPLATFGVRPGAAFVIGWYMRERILNSPRD